VKGKRPGKPISTSGLVPAALEGESKGWR